MTMPERNGDDLRAEITRMLDRATPEQIARLLRDIRQSGERAA